MSFVIVKEKAENINLGIDNMIDAMKKDYKDWSSQGFGRGMPEINKKMVDEYNNSFDISFGSKYVKIKSNRSCTAFIVNTDKDKKFKKGDILKPAGYKAPTRNKARGNVLEGDYPIRWTGPLYLDPENEQFFG